MLVLMILALTGCASGPRDERPGSSDPPEPAEQGEINQTFELTVSEANAARAMRSGHGRSCVVVQSEGETRIVGRALARWSVAPPNPTSLRFGWTDVQNVSSVSGQSPLQIEVNGTAGELGRGLTIFVGTANETLLVVEQPVTVTLESKAEGNPVRLYVSSCTVNR